MSVTIGSHSTVIEVPFDKLESFLGLLGFEGTLPCETMRKSEYSEYCRSTFYALDLILKIVLGGDVSVIS